MGRNDDYYTSGEYAGMTALEASGMMEYEGNVAQMRREAAAKKYARGTLIREIKFFRRKYAEARRTNRLIADLVRNGFTWARPICSTWPDALFKSEEGLTLFILLRRGGIDLKVFAGSSGYAFVNENRVSFSGGITLRMSFDTAGHSVISYVSYVSSLRCSEILKEIKSQEYRYAYRQICNS